MRMDKRNKLRETIQENMVFVYWNGSLSMVCCVFLTFSLWMCLYVRASMCVCVWFSYVFRWCMFTCIFSSWYTETIRKVVEFMNISIVWMRILIQVKHTVPVDFGVSLQGVFFIRLSYVCVCLSVYVNVFFPFSFTVYCLLV